jgi:hypothetical protein
MMKKRVLLFGISALLILSCLFLAACPTTSDPAKNDENLITGFILHEVSGTIDDEANTITVILPDGTSKNGTPAITVSENATLDKSGQQDFSSDVSYTVTAEDGTSRTYTVKVYVAFSALVNTVYGGSTPQADNTGWLTLAFKAENKVIAAFNTDNTTNEWIYCYDTVNSKGIIINPSGGWNPAPNGFTVSGDSKTLTITNYGFHGGDPRTFNRLRQGDDNLTVESSPADLDPLPDDLVLSVFGGSTPQDNGKGWLTITFKADSIVIFSFSADNTTNAWEYSYNSTEKTGTITNPGGGWNPAPNGFTVSGDSKTLTITNYGFHGGDPRTFNRYSSIAPPNWRWDTVILEFKAEGKVYADSLEYSYNYNNSTNTGEISGDTNRRNNQSAIDYPIVNRLGPFTISGDTLTFSNYRESGTSVVFSKRAGTVSGNDLNGTSWRFARPTEYAAAKNMIGVLWYGPNFVIECLDETNAILYAIDGYYTSVSKLTYTYDDTGPSGNMSYVSGPLNGAPNAFTVRSPHTFSPYFEDFDWRGGNKNNITAAHNLAFSNWKGYGHGWDFVKMDTNGIMEQ